MVRKRSKGLRTMLWQSEVDIFESKRRVNIRSLDVLLPQLTVDLEARDMSIFKGFLYIRITQCLKNLRSLLTSSNEHLIHWYMYCEEGVSNVAFDEQWKVKAKGPILNLTTYPIAPITTKPTPTA